MGKKAEALATEGSRRISRRICHGRKTKQKNLPRNYTEKHGNKQNKNKPRKEDISFRAGSVSDGINIRFGEGPFGKLRDQGSFGTVSELVELAVISCAGTEKSLRYACICPEGAKG